MLCSIPIRVVAPQLHKGVDATTARLDGVEIPSNNPAVSVRESGLRDRSKKDNGAGSNPSELSTIGCTAHVNKLTSPHMGGTPVRSWDLHLDIIGCPFGTGLPKLRMKLM